MNTINTEPFVNHIINCIARLPATTYSFILYLTVAPSQSPKRMHYGTTTFAADMRMC